MSADSWEARAAAVEAAAWPVGTAVQPLSAHRTDSALRGVIVRRYRAAGKPPRVHYTVQWVMANGRTLTSEWASNELAEAVADPTGNHVLPAMLF